ncbi:MAG: DUF2071 domain-containing protein [Chitinophagaceae bacterium]|nr:DUF2071 domain-containing protein [Chitinophagaceae bacterium]
MKNFLTARWENLIMANYAVPPSVLLPFLPNGVELDFFEGKTYVSLVGFMFKDTRIFGLPIPGLGTFEEINLRFYVTRKDGHDIKRGVVFINETVPYKAVAWLANRLYKEHYTAIPTKHRWKTDDAKKQIEYLWLLNEKWSHMAVEALAGKKTMVAGSIESFIFEHYYGFTRFNETSSQEYKVAHPAWAVNTVLSHDINCDFQKMYGDEFSFLNNATPDSVLLAEGSAVSVKWKRTRF